MSNRQISDTTKALIEAKGLIEDEANWCTGRLRNERGQVCAFGALIEVSKSNRWRSDESGSFLVTAANQLHGLAVPVVNNNLGHAATLEMFDRAIALSMQADAEQGQ